MRKRKQRKKTWTKRRAIVMLAAFLIGVGLFTTVAYAATPVATDGMGTYNAGTVNVETYLNLREGPGKDYDIIGHIFPGTEVEVLSTEGDWYWVSSPEGEGYVYGDYLNLFQKAEIQEAEESVITDSAEEVEDTAEIGLTPTGNLTLVDDIDVTEEEDESADTASISGTTQYDTAQQFITLTTKNGNYFYLIIDRDTNGSENVHFLNMVDESDLLALIDDEDGTEDTSEVTITDEEALALEEELEAEEAEAEMDEELEEGESSGSGMIAMVIVVLVAAGGVGYYLYRRKKTADAMKAKKPDPDADYGMTDADDAYDFPEDDDDVDIQYFDYDEQSR